MDRLRGCTRRLDEVHVFERFDERVGAAEFGTYFIGYARNLEVIEKMIKNMFISKWPGNYDRILDCSMPLTGNLFFVPTADFPRRPTPIAAIAAGVDRIRRS